MEAMLTLSFDTPSTSWASSAHSARPFRNSEPVPTTWARLPHSATVGQLALPARDRRANTSSATWTSSSGDLADLSENDDLEHRDEFVQEYNRVARKHGVRTLTPEHYTPALPGQSPLQQRRGWFSRTFLRQVSVTSDASSTKSERRIKPKRSVSDLALHLVNGTRRDNLKDEDLQSLVRICGKSKLYLPSEYAPGSLVLPTCFRATAQHLIQHGPETRGVFRIPGSVRVVNALYSYYCADVDVDEISSTTCCPNLPSHIKAGTHDVASTFKRLLSGLPGGILGSLSVFDALVAIQSQLNADIELTRTKQTKVRARLIALAIGTVKSHLRRDLICAVFGLLCLIGRTAEKAPREDEQGRPLPTSDLMGYNALGIVFGPLLVGDLLNSYIMKIANPNSGLVLFPVTPPNVRKERRKSRAPEGTRPPGLSVDKIHVANSITEMLISHWREVVRQMRSLGVMKPGTPDQCSGRRAGLRPSTSGSFSLRISRAPSGPLDPGDSPVPPSPTPESVKRRYDISRAPLVLPRRRPRGMPPMSSVRAAAIASLLSPPVEEPSPAEHDKPKGPLDGEHMRNCCSPATAEDNRGHQRESPSPVTPNRRFIGPRDSATSPDDVTRPETRGSMFSSMPTISQASPTAPTPSCKRQSFDQDELIAQPQEASTLKRRLYRDSVASNLANQGRKLLRRPSEKISQDPPRHSLQEPARTSGAEEMEEKSVGDEKSIIDVFGRGRSRLTAWRARRKSRVVSDAGSPVPRPLGPRYAAKLEDKGSQSPKRLRSKQHEPGSKVYGEDQSKPVIPRCFLEDSASDAEAAKENPTGQHGQIFDLEMLPCSSDVRPNERSKSPEQNLPLKALSSNLTGERDSLENLNPFQDQGPGEGAMTDNTPKISRRMTTRVLPLGPREQPEQPTLGTVPRSKPVRSSGSAVKAMAAMFESASRESRPFTPPAERVSSLSGCKPAGMLSPYTVNPPPAKPQTPSPKASETNAAGRHTWLSTIRDRRLLESTSGGGGTARNEEPSQKRRSGYMEGSVPGAVKSTRVDTWYDGAVSSGTETTDGGQSAARRSTPKTLGPNAPSIPGQNIGGSPVKQEPCQGTMGAKQTPTARPVIVTSAPKTDPGQISATPHLSQPSPSPQPPLVREDSSRRTSTTRRFSLLPTLDKYQQIMPNLTIAAQNTPEHTSTTATCVTETANQDAELARLREQLSRAEQECSMWRERAERAEQRVRALERESEAYRARAEAGVSVGATMRLVGADGASVRPLDGDGVNDGRLNGMGPGHGKEKDAVGLRTFWAEEVEVDHELDASLAKVTRPAKDPSSEGEALAQCVREMRRALDGE
ncbi:hypothetical protein VTI74DRAFT_9890 [Chaetomium olivicolor]